MFDSPQLKDAQVAYKKGREELEARDAYRRKRNRNKRDGLPTQAEVTKAIKAFKQGGGLITTLPKETEPLRNRVDPQQGMYGDVLLSSTVPPASVGGRIKPAPLSDSIRPQNVGHLSIHHGLKTKMRGL